jgi:hypothetical protein
MTYWLTDYYGVGKENTMSIRMPTHLLPYLPKSEETEETEAVCVLTYKDPGKAELGIDSIPIPRGPGEHQLEAIFEVMGEMRYFDAETGPWIAGGAARRLYEGKALDQGDVDIFFQSYDQYKLTKAAFAGQEVVFESKRATSYKIAGLKVQLINRRYYKDNVEVLKDFDFSVTQFITDGKRIYTTEEARNDHAAKRLRYATVGRVEEHSMLKRMIKYSNYGFTPEYGLATVCLKNALDYSSHVVILGSVAKHHDSNYEADANPEISCDTEERQAIRNEWSANAAFNVASRMEWFK